MFVPAVIMEKMDADDKRDLCEAAILLIISETAESRNAAICAMVEIVGEAAKPLRVLSLDDLPRELPDYRNGDI